MKKKASQFGLNTAIVGKEIRAYVDGLEIDETRINDEKAKIKIRYRGNKKRFYYWIIKSSHYE